MAPDDSIRKMIFTAMLESRPEAIVTSYEAAYNLMLSDPSVLFFGSRDTFFGCEGLLALNIQNQVQFPTAPALPKGSEFGWVGKMYISRNQAFLVLCS